MNDCGMPRLATVVWLFIAAFTAGAVAVALFLVGAAYLGDGGIDPWS